jgi:hypothetical protein
MLATAQQRLPAVICGGELGNSTASSMPYMRPLWPRFVKMNCNTILAPVYWELLEPREGHFDFTLVDSLVVNARHYKLNLVLLWFGTWKNSMSCYAPEWVKLGLDRFPRVRATNGRPEEIITPFSKEALLADKKAFVALMQHLKTIDGARHTVLMVQVENEIGMLPEARDHSAAANEAFNAPVPQKLLTALNKPAGNWEEVFGKSLATDEKFMAWYFGVYVDEIAKAGKAIYDIPMYVNAALNAPGRKPGEYPSAGPLPHLMEIWKAAAPNIDFLSPDFYNPNFQEWCDRYTREDNPLFIPEHRLEPGVDAKAFYAFGHYHAIGFSPFSIESAPKPEEEPIGKAYALIRQLTPLITHTKKERIDGVLLSKEADTTRLEMGGYKITAAHELKLGWSPKAKDEHWPLTGAIIIAVTDSEFVVAGTGIVLSFEPSSPGRRAGILTAEEGQYVDGKWTPGRRMNGDQDHQGRHLRIPEGEYAIQRIRLYTYK